MTEQAPSPAAAPDMAHYVAQYVALRDKEKEISERHAAELAPFKAMKEKLEAFFLQTLQSQNVDNMKTAGGTVYITTKTSASIADGEAFWEYVSRNQLWHLIDKRANAPAITEFLEQYKALPPGVNFSKFTKVGVRRS